MSLVDQIQADFPLTQHEVRVLLMTAAYRYKLHFIEKRHGRGKRLIAQPTAEIKILQRWAVENYVNNLPVHEAAKAYRHQTSIYENAAAHAANSYLLKLDFENFFPSILGEHFSQHLKSNLEVTDEDADFLMRLLFRYDREKKKYVLSIGAPSSPAVSNAIMYQFDMRLAIYCSERDIAYTRYADDLALSTNKPRQLHEAKLFVARLCQGLPYPRLSLNEGKTVFTSKKFRRQITGLVLTNDGKPSLGREKKRLIRSMAHHYSIGGLSPERTAHLRGLLAFALSIEPPFVQSIERMIGEEVFRQLMRGQ